MARKLIADAIPQKSSQPATQSAPAPKFATKFKGLLGKNLVVAALRDHVSDQERKEIQRLLDDEKG
jgi:uncharacterized membrane protein YebE (DUF533 family)